MPPPAAVVSVDQNVVGQGFLFLPYGATEVRLDRGRATELADGVMQVGSSRGPVRYEADVARVPPRGSGRGAIAASDVPGEIQKYALELTGDLTDPKAIAARIEQHFARSFVYTLDPPRGAGDPVVHFLLHSKAGHCEFFASAAAMMLAVARDSGAPRHGLVRRRGGAPVADGRRARAKPPRVGRGGFRRAAASSPSTRRRPRAFRLCSRLTPSRRACSRSAARSSSSTTGASSDSIRATRPGHSRPRGIRPPRPRTVSLRSSRRCARRSRPTSRPGSWPRACWAALLIRLLEVRRRHGPATRAYLSLRHEAARRGEKLGPGTPPAEVARRFARRAPGAAEDAHALVETYCASAFGGIEPDEEGLRELEERVRRVRVAAGRSA